MRSTGRRPNERGLCKQKMLSNGWVWEHFHGQSVLPTPNLSRIGPRNAKQSGASAEFAHISLFSEPGGHLTPRDVDIYRSAYKNQHARIIIKGRRTILH